MTALPRAKCPTCNTDVALRNGGEFREHRPSGKSHLPKCPASGKTLAALQAELDNAKPAEPKKAAKASKATPAKASAGAALADAVATMKTPPAKSNPKAAAESIAKRHGHSSVWRGAAAETVALDELTDNPNNPRTDVGDVTELAASLDAHGMIEPVIATRRDAGGFTIIAGHRRVAAAREAGWQEVPVLVRDDLTDPGAALEAMIIENLQRSDLTPLEEANAFRDLRGLGLTQTDIAERVGINQGTVSKRLSLLKLPERAQAMLTAGELDIADAIELARLPSDAAEVATAKIATGAPAGSAVRNARQAHERAAQREKVIAALDAAGVPVVDKAPWPGHYARANEENPALPLSELDGSVLVAQRGGPHGERLEVTVPDHTGEPCHLAYVAEAWEGGEYVSVPVFFCSDARRHGHDLSAPGETRDVDPEQEAAYEAARAAAEALDAAFAKLRASKPSRAVLGDLLQSYAACAFLSADGLIYEDDFADLAEELGVAMPEEGWWSTSEALDAALDAAGMTTDALAWVTVCVAGRRYFSRSFAPDNRFALAFGRAVLEELSAATGYEPTSADVAKTKPAMPSTPPPLADWPDDVDEDTGEPVVAWYAGTDPDDDPPRFIYDAGEASAIEANDGVIVYREDLADDTLGAAFGSVETIAPPELNATPPRPGEELDPPAETTADDRDVVEVTPPAQTPDPNPDNGPAVSSFDPDEANQEPNELPDDVDLATYGEPVAREVKCKGSGKEAGASIAAGARANCHTCGALTPTTMRGRFVTHTVLVNAPAPV